MYIPDTSTVWVVQRESTGKIIAVCRRMHVAKMMVALNPTLKYERWDLS